MFLILFSNHLYNTIRMTQKRAGRPTKNNSKVDVDSLLIEFLAKKKTLMAMRYVI